MRNERHYSPLSVYVCVWVTQACSNTQHRCSEAVTGTVNLNNQGRNDVVWVGFLERHFYPFIITLNHSTLSMEWYSNYPSNEHSSVCVCVCVHVCVWLHQLCDGREFYWSKLITQCRRVAKQLRSLLFICTVAFTNTHVHTHQWSTADGNPLPRVSEHINDSEPDV